MTIPVKVLRTAGDTHGLGDFAPGDTIPVEHGGTGLADVLVTGDLLYATGADSLGLLALGTVGQVLRSDGSAPQWSTLAKGDLPAEIAYKDEENVYSLKQMVLSPSFIGAWSGRVTGDIRDRFSLALGGTGGYLAFGDGINPVDARIIRTGAQALVIDGSTAGDVNLTVTGTLAVTGIVAWGGGAAIGSSDLVAQRDTKAHLPASVAYRDEANTLMGDLILGASLYKNVAASQLIMSGGSAPGSGANIELYGESHASQANNAFYDADKHTFRSVASALRMEVDGTGARIQNGLEVAGRIRPISSQIALDGSIYKSTSNGLALTGMAGTLYDLVLHSPTAGIALGIPTGTSNVVIPGSSSLSVGGEAIFNSKLIFTGTFGIDHKRGDTNTGFDLDFPDLTSAWGKVRIGRLTNTTSSSVGLSVYRGDGTSNLVFDTTRQMTRIVGAPLLMNHTTISGANAGDISLKNESWLKAVNVAGTTNRDIIRKDSSDRTELGLNSLELVLTNALTSTTVGAAGLADALPANPTGYLSVLIGGSTMKIPYYAA